MSHEYVEILDRNTRAPIVKAALNFQIEMSSPGGHLGLELTELLPTVRTVIDSERNPYSTSKLNHVFLTKRT